MNTPYQDRTPPGPQRSSRLPDRRRAHNLATRLGRARLVHLLGRSGTLLTDWVPLGLAAAAVGLLVLVGPGLQAMLSA